MHAIQELESFSLKKRVLFITRNMPPLVGGMERLMEHTFQELAHNYTVDLIGPKGCEKFVGNYASKITTCSVSSISFFILQTLFKSIIMVMRTRYDLVFAGSGTTGLATVLAAKLTRTKSVVYLHGLDIVADDYIYQKIFLPVISRSTRIMVNSKNTKKLAIEAGIMEDKIIILNPGVDLVDTDNINIGKFFEENDLDNTDFHILSVGRITKRKGLMQFVMHALPELARKSEKIKLIVIGEEPSDAIGGNTESVKKILNWSKEHRISGHITFLGKVSDKSLHQAYAACNILIFPLVEVKGDVEGFGMVAIEAASHGLPTIAFNTGGIGDAVVNEKTGYLIEPGRYDVMIEKILYCQKNDVKTSLKENCQSFASKFDWKQYGKKLRSECSKITG
ncbi:MAG: glycosyltransferase family 4 protein [Gammaproteobacteria bacterium]|nr:MAG: glycosyltransferase family 4 protein [Gammaproteobacteria bacterium]